MDMYRTYYETLKSFFPNASFVIDRFHLYRQMTGAFENVRKAVQKDFCDSRRIYFKRSKKRLCSRRCRLSSEDCLAVDQMISLSDRLTKAYYAKELFY